MEAAAQTEPQGEPRTDPRDPQGGGRRSSTVGLWATVAVVVVAIVAATWSATRLGDVVVAPAVAVLATGAATVAIAVAGRRLARGDRRRRRTAVAVTLLAGTVVLVASVSGSLTRMKVASSEPTWLATAESVLAHGAERGSSGDPSIGAPCWFGPQLAPDLRELEGFGRVDQICATNGSAHQQVSFSQRDNPANNWTSLVYAPDGADLAVSGGCLAHLDGPWWQTASADPDCPPGYEAIPAGGG